MELQIVAQTTHLLMQNDCRICMLLPLPDQSGEIQDSSCVCCCSSLFQRTTFNPDFFLVAWKRLLSHRPSEAQARWAAAISWAGVATADWLPGGAAVLFIGLSPSLSAALVQPLSLFMFSLSLSNTFITPSSTVVHLSRLDLSYCPMDNRSFSIFPVMLLFHAFSSLFISSPEGETKPFPPYKLT